MSKICDFYRMLRSICPKAELRPDGTGEPYHRPKRWKAAPAPLGKDIKVQGIADHGCLTCAMQIPESMYIGPFTNGWCLVQAVVICSNVEVVVEDAKQTAKEKGVFLIPPTSRFRIRNLGENPAELILHIWSVPSGTPLEDIFNREIQTES
ncbi:MAG: uncharacterized protein KVP18_000876 [Porospora cf. gigantea A]|uniref:uncharacterized protein n=1 Tax=Porospora cf. gigantea A TaxID=2853593 RepID=UPI00355A779C|nr:MAG: hypothetical protein KVP18_000876 [Porospora cf. gigantea A]